MFSLNFSKPRYPGHMVTLYAVFFVCCILICKVVFLKHKRMVQKIFEWIICCYFMNENVRNRKIHTKGFG